ncbi:MAG: NDP-sugar epimerase [Pelagibacterales bacterium]|nr:NDP-sugar epimerase [Pelagibacterales bacterium]|tara:strand:- start:1921 stop:2916 length:996 start_codon:yes stop_codon:yes gene_type:complete
MINNKSILITGGTGSFGQRFIDICLKKYNPKKLIVYSRDELKQYEMQKKYSKKNLNKIRFFIGDIRDLPRLKLAMQDVDYVIHAAALKQVPTAEYNPFEVVKTNVVGSQNVIDAALDSGVKKVLSLSTDKAAAPINLYGTTKLTSDKLFVAANNFKGKKNICFSIVRYGNVMGSRGSVIPLFLNQVREKFFTITDPAMTRFNITLDEGVDFVINSINEMIGGEIFVPKLASYRITDLANAISLNKKIKIIGIRPGEKIHEELITSSDSMNTLEYKNKYIILPNYEFYEDKLNKFKKHYKKSKKCKLGFTYNSKDNVNFLSVKELKNLILSK